MQNKAVLLDGTRKSGKILKVENVVMEMMIVTADLVKKLLKILLKLGLYFGC